MPPNTRKPGEWPAHLGPRELQPHTFPLPSGADIRRLRKHLGMNQQAFAATLGCDQSMVSRLERDLIKDLGREFSDRLRALWTKAFGPAAARHAFAAPAVTDAAEDLLVDTIAKRVQVAFKVEPGPRGGKTIQIENPDIADDVLKLIQLFGAAQPGERQAILMRLQHPGLAPGGTASAIGGLSDEDFEAMVLAGIRASGARLTRAQELQAIASVLEMRDEIVAGRADLSRALAQVGKPDDRRAAKPAPAETGRSKSRA